MDDEPHEIPEHASSALPLLCDVTVRDSLCLALVPLPVVTSPGRRAHAGCKAREVAGGGAALRPAMGKKREAAVLKAVHSTARRATLPTTRAHHCAHGLRRHRDERPHAM